MQKDEAQTKPRRDEDALLILMPSRGSICHETLVSLDLNVPVPARRTLRIARKPVDEARNDLARFALEAIESGTLFDFTPRETFLLWVDDDAWLPPGLVPQMMACMREPSMQNADALFAWFGMRLPYSTPAAWRKASDPNSFPQINVDCKRGDLVDIECAGFHCVLMRPRLLQRLGPNPFTVENGYPEDFIFCERARVVGARLVLGTGFSVVHVDPRDGTAYLPGEPAMMMDGNRVMPISTQHLGASGVKSSESRQYGIAGGDAFSETEKIAAERAAEMEQRREVSAG